MLLGLLFYVIGFVILCFWDSSFGGCQLALHVIKCDSVRIEFQFSRFSLRAGLLPQLHRLQRAFIRSVNKDGALKLFSKLERAALSLCGCHVTLLRSVPFRVSVS